MVNQSTHTTYCVAKFKCDLLTNVHNVKLIDCSTIKILPEVPGKQMPSVMRKIKTLVLIQFLFNLRSAEVHSHQEIWRRWNERPRLDNRRPNYELLVKSRLIFHALLLSAPVVFLWYDGNWIALKEKWNLEWIQTKKDPSVLFYRFD